MPYLMCPGEGTVAALHTRCEDELWAKAELMLPAEIAQDDPSNDGSPVVGPMDVDPTFSIGRFKRSYRCVQAPVRQ